MSPFYLYLSPLLGLLLCPFIDLGKWNLFLSGFLVAIFFIAGRRFSFSKKLGHLLLFLSLSFGLREYFSYRFQLTEDAFNQISENIAEVMRKKNAVLLWEGELIEKPLPSNGKQKLGVKADALYYWTKSKDNKTPVELSPTKVWFEMKFKMPFLNRGQRVQVQLPAKYLTLSRDVPGGYGGYLVGKGVVAKGFLFSPQQVNTNEKIEISPREKSIFTKYQSLVGRVQLKVRERFKKHLGAEAYGLSYALITGDKGGIPFESKEIFRLTGVYHVLAVSGMHAGILTVVFFSLLRLAGLSRRYSMGVVLLLILPLYMCIADFQISLIRTYFMLLLAFYLKYIDCKTEPVLIVLFTLLVSVLIEPGLVKNISFQLSYGAVIGIMFSLKVMKRYQIKHWTWQYVLVSLGAQSFTLPLVLFYFGYFNYLSLFYSLPISLLLSFSLLFSILLALSPGGMLSAWIGSGIAITNLFSVKLLDWTHVELDSFFLLEANDLNGAMGVFVVVGLLWAIVIKKINLKQIAIYSEIFKNKESRDNHGR